MVQPNGARPLCALVPALVSYIALVYIVHLEAMKLGLKGMQKPPSSLRTGRSPVMAAQRSRPCPTQTPKAPPDRRRWLRLPLGPSAPSCRSGMDSRGTAAGRARSSSSCSRRLRLFLEKSSCTAVSTRSGKWTRKCHGSRAAAICQLSCSPCRPRCFPSMCTGLGLPSPRLLLHAMLAQRPSGIWRSRRSHRQSHSGLLFPQEKNQPQSRHRLLDACLPGLKLHTQRNRHSYSG